MKHSKIPLSQTIVGLCKMHNIKHIVISPGSRNAPLTIGFTNHTFFKCYSIVDERCAAFFTLGIAQQTQQPVALVCTSGSALLNYFPAIAEAYYSHIPLVVLSADRPKHLVDIGDGQTIKQPNVYGDHVLYSTNLKLDLNEVDNEDEDLPIFKNLENKVERFLGIQKDIQSYNEDEINKALLTAKQQSAPVHINIPFEEPLYETVEDETINLQPITKTTDVEAFEFKDLKHYQNNWESASKKMILVGTLQPNTIETKWLNQLALDDSVIILTETTSNLHHNHIFNSIDQLIAPLSETDFKALQPDVLLTLGGMVVSKKIKAFLRKYQPKHHWHVGKHKANDTFFCLKQHFKCSENTFFNAFLDEDLQSIKSHYKTYWLNVRQQRRQKHQAYLSTIPFSDFKAFQLVLDSLPQDSQLQVGNSSAIRYTQLFQLKPNIEVFCNRGTSGIDGSTSTAIGASVAANKRVTFVTGDLSFFYDSNALWNNNIPKTFRIIVINNGGGGIFRILPGHKNTKNFDTYFETKHNLTAEELCKMYGFEYLKSTNEDELKDKLNLFYNNSESPKLLEIFTPSTLNDEVLLKYFKFIELV